MRLSRLFWSLAVLALGVGLWTGFVGSGEPETPDARASTAAVKEPARPTPVTVPVAMSPTPEPGPVATVATRAKANPAPSVAVRPLPTPTQPGSDLYQPVGAVLTEAGQATARPSERAALALSVQSTAASPAPASTGATGRKAPPRFATGQARLRERTLVPKPSSRQASTLFEHPLGVR
jgi:hypothetical protein